MNAHPDPHATAKRQILVGLSHALAALSERMRSQQDAAVKITLLAVRAESIAERSWELSHARGEAFRRDSEALIRDIKTFAADVANAAKRAGEEALLGREVARAIAAHSQDVADLARRYRYPAGCRRGSGASAATVRDPGHAARTPQGKRGDRPVGQRALELSPPAWRSAATSLPAAASPPAGRRWRCPATCGTSRKRQPRYRWR